MATTATGNESWLRDEVFLAETRSQLCFQSLKAWWGETTDIVILNSPLLNRATGNAFRCITLCSLTFVACSRHEYLKAINENKPGLVAVGTMMLVIGSIASFVAAVWRQRESVRSSWFYSFVVAVSLQLLLRVRQVHTAETRFLSVAAVVCHCNIHPVPLLLVIGPMLYNLWYTTLRDGDFLGSLATIDSVWCTTFLLLMFSAFTRDFTIRVKAISTGMILPQEGGQPHDSPLSGRSCRSMCWLMVLSIWLAWGALMIGKASYKIQAGPYYEYLFQNRLPICTWLVPLVLFASILALWLSGKRGGRCAMWQADLTLFMCSCTPPGMIFADLIILGTEKPKPIPLEIEFSFQFYTRVQSMLFVAGQLLVQAGCHPIVCIGPSVILGLQALAAYVWAADIVVYTPFSHEEIAGTFALSFFIWISHTVDYVTRYRAIREGLERARENAASNQSLLDSCINSHKPWVELQRLPLDRAAAPTTTFHPASVAVAVVRHAERADGAHAYDDWGCSEDGIPCFTFSTTNPQALDLLPANGSQDAAEFPFDPPITAEGVQQAKQLADDLKTQLVSLDVIISSPYLRCLQTAEILAEEFGVLVLLDAELGHSDERSPQLSIGGSRSTNSGLIVISD
eukprot:Skav222458  [mRNA]  locus=scaffold3319:157498:160760:+ [translate_table: standard]